jgi:FtsP/CotA-like multicopper oxidase with cupredoxin domain
VIQDRTLNRNNQLVYQGNGMMDQMMGFLGAEIWVNGKPDFVLPVATRAYRLRLLNGSNSRIYKLGWDDDGTPLTVIATDGGLLERVVQRPYVMLAPGERLELWADFSGRPVGSELELLSLPFTTPEMMGGMGNRRGGMMGSVQAGISMAQGAAFPILTVRIEREVQETIALPSHLTSINHPSPTEAVNAENPHTIAMQMRMPGGWTLNGRTFDMTGVANDEIVWLGSTEVWELVNQGGGMGMMGGMMLPRAMHVHGESFQIVERQIDPSMRAMWETVSAGYVDEGWKDTVLVMPGERVNILRRFSDYTGMYLVHCHNLEHENDAQLPGGPGLIQIFAGWKFLRIGGIT